MMEREVGGMVKSQSGIGDVEEGDLWMSGVKV